MGDGVVRTATQEEQTLPLPSPHDPILPIYALDLSVWRKRYYSEFLLIDAATILGTYKYILL